MAKSHSLLFPLQKYDMMGWLVGHLHNNKNLLMHLFKIHNATIFCTPHVFEEAAIVAPTCPQEPVKNHQKLLKEKEISFVIKLTD